MATQQLRTYTQWLPEDANRDSNTEIYGANSTGDTKIQASKLISLWSSTRTYTTGEVCFTTLGNFFRALQDNTNLDPEDVANATYWESAGGSGSGTTIGNIHPDPAGSKGNETWTETSGTVTTQASGLIGFPTELKLLTTGAGTLTETIDVPIQLRGQNLELRFEGYVNAGTPTFKIYRADGTTEIAKTGSTLPTAGGFNAYYSFFASADSTIKLIWTGTNIDVRQTNIYLGRAISVYGAGIGQDRTYTPTLTNAGTSPSTTRASFNEVGEFYEGSIKVVLGTALPASELRIGLPSDQLSASDYATLEVCGVVTRSTSIAEPIYTLIEPSKGYLVFGRQYASSGSLTKLNANAFSASEVLSITFRVKMAHMVGQNVIELAQSAGGLYLSNNTATDANDSTDANTYRGSDGSTVPSVTTSAKTKRVVHRALLPNEVRILEFRHASTKTWIASTDLVWTPAAGLYCSVATDAEEANAAANSSGAGLLPIDDTHTDIVFLAVASRANGTNYSWATFGAVYDRYRVRIGPQNAVELPPVIVVHAKKSSGTQSVTGTVTDLVWANTIVDTSSGFNLTTFVCKIEGWYRVGLNLMSVAGGATVFAPAVNGVYKGDYIICHCLGSSNGYSGTTLIRLNSNDNLTIRTSDTVTVNFGTFGATTLTIQYEGK